MAAVEWHKVTWYSKLIAMVIFIIFPFISFYYGIQYGQDIEQASQPAVQTSTTAPASPGQEYYSNVAEWQVGQNTDGGFRIAYPIDFAIDQDYSPAPTNDWRLGANGTQGNIFFTLTIPSAFEPQTNFADAKLTVGASRASAAVAQCLTPDQGAAAATTTSTATVQGVPFTVFKSADAGAGNYYETTSYRTVHDGQCYAVEYTVHSGQIGNYPSEYNLQPFDDNQVQSLLDRVAGTFQFM